MSKQAVFVDRDNTLMDDPGYLADPGEVKLLPGVELAIKSLRQAGFMIVVVTNQSGVARGLLSEETLEKIHAALREQLAEKGATLDAIFYCPYHPDGSVEKYARQSDLRKPAPGMLIKAAEQLDIDLANSWMVGDSSRDIGAGQRAGCRTVRVRSQGSHPVARKDEDGNEEFQADFSARNLVEAARVIKRESTPATPAEAQGEPVAAAPGAGAGVEGEKTPASNAEDDTTVRREILRHVRQLSRQGEHEEFSITNLLGGVAQVLVGLFLLLVFYKALGTGQVHQATLWATIAAVFQIMSLTFFTMSKKKN